MSVYAPGYGLICTLIGQCVMFRDLGGGADFNKVGSAMAVALLGTLYGVVMCNLFCLPFADKLEARSSQEMLIKELYLQGVLAIATDLSVIVLKQKLLAFLDTHAADRLGSAI
jgi:chemotaxis protein MotA